MTQKLPDWDLSDLYKNDKEAEEALKVLESTSQKFNQLYKGNLEKIPAADFYKSLMMYNDIIDMEFKIYDYAFFQKQVDQNNEKISTFFQSIVEFIQGKITPLLVFYQLELGQLSDAKTASFLADDKVAFFKPFIHEVQKFKPYNLSEEMSIFNSDLQLTGSRAWHKVYSETIASIRIEMEGQTLSMTETTNIANNDPSAEKRLKAGGLIAEALNKNAVLIASVFNNIAKEKETQDKWHKMPTMMSDRNLSNNVAQEVVDALVSSVKAGYPIAHRYYKLKAKWMGKEKLHYWDRNATLDIGGGEKKYTWEEAVQIVSDAYKRFSPDFFAVAENFFKNNWIDVGAKKGKRGGAFAASVCASVHPYLLLNFMGKSDDIKTLAHELGHGVHQMLSREQTNLMMDTPLTIAETASIFGEAVTFDYLFENEKDPLERFKMLIGRIEDALNTSFRQIAFHEFEVAYHTERREKGELSKTRLDELYAKTQKEVLGDHVIVDETAAPIWGYISHFVGSPFYVYAYAFGYCLVNSLYKTYQEGTVLDFEEKYMDMLRQGGSKGHKELFAPFGLDTASPDFWKKGMDVLSEMVGTAEKLAKEIGLDK
ncbi:MAG: M3 family oligoendopeptidase [Lactobacillales bacterium]|jgi:oligoendopeptidase F|nr:M3 family oligoendopeptidase [Lactobacillales bacterium]